MLKTKHFNLFILLIMTVIILYTGYVKVFTHISFVNLMNNKQLLKEIVAENYFLSVLIFIIIYILSAILLIPDTAVLQLAGGFLFGVIPGIFYVSLGAQIGAVTAFLISRWMIGEWIQKKYWNDLVIFNNEIEKNGYSYLLTLRLLPVFPYFLVNVLAGISKIKYNTYSKSTILGMFPGLLIYTYIGSQLETIASVKDIMTVKIIFILILLTLLAFVPTVITKKKFRAKKI